MQFKYIIRALFLTCLCLGSVSGRADGVRVQDDLGRWIALEQPAQRIVSLAPNITENLFAIGAGDQLVGVIEGSDYPAQALGLPRVGDYNGISFEQILLLQPDVVVAWRDGITQAQIARLEQLGIPVLVESAESFAAIARALRRLGVLTGKTKIAEPKAAEFETSLAKLRMEYGSARLLNVFYELWHQPLMTVNGSLLSSEAIGICGGRNIYADAVQAAPQVSLEAVLQANPDVIIGSSGQGDWRARWQRWSYLHAVQADTLYPADADRLHRSTLRSLQGIEQLCQQLDDARAKLDKRQPVSE